MRSLWILALFALVYSANSVCAEPLAVVYPDRPPLNYTDDGKPAGTLIDLTMKIFADAGVEAVFTEMPSKRILLEMQAKGSQLCSFGWFKNSEREAFAQFTLPIFQDNPLVAVMLKKNAPLFAGKTTLKDLAADKALTLGAVAGWSYGEYVDGVLKQQNVPVSTAINSQQLGILLAKGRYSYVIVRPWEVAGIITYSETPPDEILVLPLADLKERSKRYIMCGKGVPGEVVARLNASIPKFASLEE